MEWTVLDRGEVLMRTGDPGDDLYVVAGGRLNVAVVGADGTETIVREIGRGSTVGEVALLTGSRRTATVRAVRDTLVGRLSRDVVRAADGGGPARARSSSPGSWPAGCCPGSPPRRTSAPATVALVPAAGIDVAGGRRAGSARPCRSAPSTRSPWTRPSARARPGPPAGSPDERALADYLDAAEVEHPLDPPDRRPRAGLAVDRARAPARRPGAGRRPRGRAPRPADARAADPDRRDRTGGPAGAGVRPPGRAARRRGSPRSGGTPASFTRQSHLLAGVRGRLAAARPAPHGQGGRAGARWGRSPRVRPHRRAACADRVGHRDRPGRRQQHGGARRWPVVDRAHSRGDRGGQPRDLARDPAAEGLHVPVRRAARLAPQSYGDGRVPSATGGSRTRPASSSAPRRT